MRKFVKAFTVKEKIKPVWNGEIKMSIRPISLEDHSMIASLRPPKGKDLLDEVRENMIVPKDQILWHTWEGRPYFSGWGKRLRVEVTEVQNIRIFKEGIMFGIVGDHRQIYVTLWEELNDLAKKDGIACGKHLGQFFNGMYHLNSALKKIEPHKDLKQYFQILQWEIIGPEGVTTYLDKNYMNENGGSK